MTDIQEIVDGYFETWRPHCRAPDSVFASHFRAVVGEILDEIEKRADTNVQKSVPSSLAGAMREIRKELNIPKREE